MPEHPLWFVGDRNPAISDTVSIDGVGVDLTTKTVTFKMRAIGSTTLKVNAAVTTKDANGVWTYGWGASDLDTAGEYLVWVTVDMGGGGIQTVNEAKVVVAAHAPLTNAYVELEEFKSTTELTGKNLADSDIRIALVAASRGIDRHLDRRFYPDADAAQVRYYTPHSPQRLWIDDLITLTTFKTDDDGDGTFENTWTVNTDFVLAPLNAVADGEPYTHIEVNGAGSFRLPCNGYPRSVEITGKFGWAAAPAGVKELTTLIAHRIVKRKRQAPFGGAIGLDLDIGVRERGMCRNNDLGFVDGLDATAAHVDRNPDEILARRVQIGGAPPIGPDTFTAVEVGAIVTSTVLAGVVEGQIVYVTGFFDPPSPGQTLEPASPSGSFFDGGTPGGPPDSGSPSGAFFDMPRQG